MTPPARGGTVGFAGDHPGTILAVEIEAGESILVQRGGFIAASPSVVLSVGLVKRLWVGLADHTLVLQRVTGPGTVFVHAAGDFAESTLAPDEALRADAHSLVSR